MENGLPPIARLRPQIEGEEFDYLALLRSLQDYAYPRDLITTMLRRGYIVRVKKGIYVFGDAHARRPYSREILANMIYGPSYVSLDSARLPPGHRSHRDHGRLLPARRGREGFGRSSHG